MYSYRELLLRGRCWWSLWSECRRRELLVGRRHYIDTAVDVTTLYQSPIRRPHESLFTTCRRWQRCNSRTRNRRATVLGSVVGDEDVQVVGVLIVYSFSCRRFKTSSSPPWWATFSAVDENVSTIADRRQCQCLDERGVVLSETCRGAIDGFLMYAV